PPPDPGRLLGPRRDARAGLACRPRGGRRAGVGALAPPPGDRRAGGGAGGLGPLPGRRSGGGGRATREALRPRGAVAPGGGRGERRDRRAGAGRGPRRAGGRAAAGAWLASERCCGRVLAPVAPLAVAGT